MFPAYISCSWSQERLFPRFKPIYVHKNPRAFAIYWSTTLGYGRLWPQPTLEELSSFYATETYNNYLSGAGENQAPKLDLFSRLVLKIAYWADHGVDDPLPTIRLQMRADRFSCCDIGCGAGSFLAKARNYGPVCGVDPSPVSLRSLAAQHIEGYTGTAEQLPEEL